jgi:hypothetical protein
MRGQVYVPPAKMCKVKFSIERQCEFGQHLNLVRGVSLSPRARVGAGLWVPEQRGEAREPSHPSAAPRPSASSNERTVAHARCATVSLTG